MKPTLETYKESLDAIEILASSGKFSNAHHLCNDLTRFSLMSEFKEGILISEVLERIFDELALVTSEYSISEKDLIQLQNSLKSSINQIIVNFRTINKIQLFDALSDIRSTTTKFQWMCWTHSDRKMPYTLKSKIERAIK